MRKEMEEYFRGIPEGSTEVVSVRRTDNGKCYVGIVHKCKLEEWRYLMQMGRGVPVGGLLNPWAGIRASVKLFFYSLYAGIRSALGV